MAINISDLPASKQFRLVFALTKLSTIGGLDHVGTYAIDSVHNEDIWLTEEMSDISKECLEEVKGSSPLLRNIERLTKCVKNGPADNIRTLSKSIGLSLKTFKGNKEIISSAMTISNQLPLLYYEYDFDFELENFFDLLPKNYIISEQDKFFLKTLTENNKVIDNSNIVEIIDYLSKAYDPQQVVYKLKFEFCLKKDGSINQGTPIYVHMQEKTFEANIGIMKFIRLVTLCIVSDSFEGIRVEYKNKDITSAVTLQKNINLIDIFYGQDPCNVLNGIFEQLPKLVETQRSTFATPYTIHKISSIKIDKSKLAPFMKDINKEFPSILNNQTKKMMSTPKIPPALLK